MDTRVIVLVGDQDDPKHGEIKILEDRRKAERLIETLLEAGFERERIQVFAGSGMEMQIVQRPVVSLLGEAPVPPKDNVAPEAEGEGVSGEAGEEVEGESETDVVRDGARFSERFSDLFR